MTIATFGRLDESSEKSGLQWRKGNAVAGAAEAGRPRLLLGNAVAAESERPSGTLANMAVEASGLTGLGGVQPRRGCSGGIVASLCLLAVLAPRVSHAAGEGVVGALRAYYNDAQRHRRTASDDLGWIQRMKATLDTSKPNRKGAEAAMVVGLLWEKHGMDTRALVWLTKAAAWRPPGEAWVVLSATRRCAQIHMGSRRWAEALKALRNFEQQCGRLAEPDRQHAIVQDHLRYLQIVPLKRADCLRGLGKEKEAAVQLEAYVKDVESGARKIPREYEGLGFDVPNTLTNLAATFMRLGDREGAVAAYNKILTDYPDSLDRAWVSYEMARARGLTSEEELKVMARIVEELPKEKYSLQIMDKLFTAYGRAKRPLRVVHWAQRLLKALDRLPKEEAATMGVLRRDALLFLAVAWQALGNYARADACFSDLAKEHPSARERANARRHAADMANRHQRIMRLEPLGLP